MKTRVAVIGMAIAFCPTPGCSSHDQAVVPDVVGTDVSSAYNKLRRAGFAVRIDERIDVTPNHISNVSRQSIDAGTEASLGSTIELELSPGPHGLLPPGPPALRIPRLVGKPLDEAVRLLMTLGLSWSAAPLPPLRRSTEPGLLSNYVVTGQKPRPGAWFVQTRTKTIAGGIATQTTTVWLQAREA
jgi:beta-lactam-binding protein with PASTA domain